ncbi:CPBP family intramembrane metalloprotease [Carboxylicivirga sp. A043]|uniref:CPBP family intramembrane glutamic endopeptidase n=1 Tax=Carboxylicivirga litoralis TaxID=2816963 RepID=UPI0021CB8216|nr:CPBP family intramembrane glutamic endopeptidase [Carboxylicivirga sp. A043]MCU4155752.1 CPBP family intramembrane metalloprotease [Carboxylicivirga sp. A043]
MKHLESALTKDNEWFGYFLMLTIIPFVSQLPAILPFIIIKTITPLPEGVDESMVDLMNPVSYGVNPTIALALMIFPFITMLIGFIACYKPFHGRNFKNVINGTTSIRWRRIIIGFAVCFVVASFFLVVDYYMNIKKYELRLNWRALIPLAVVSFLLIPFQAFYEEIVFRGYIAQGVGRLFKNRLVVILVPSLLFALLHAFNPEVEKHGFWAMMPFYFIAGLTYAIISILDDGIELAMGLHAANNIFSSIFIVTEDSVFQTEALLLLKNVEINTEYLPFILSQIIIVGAIAFKYRWKLKTLFTKVGDDDKELEFAQV